MHHNRTCSLRHSLSCILETRHSLTQFNDNFDFSRDYFNQFTRLILYDLVNQVIPVIFKVTGQETLDVVTLPKGFNAKNINSTTGSTNIVQIPYGVTSKVRLAVRNTGDAPIQDCTANVTTGLQSALANPYKTKIIAEAKIKSDKLDARILADLLRV
jgi:hypothetical protein